MLGSPFTNVVKTLFRLDIVALCPYNKKNIEVIRDDSKIQDDSPIRIASAIRVIEVLCRCISMAVVAARSDTLVSRSHSRICEKICECVAFSRWFP